MVTPSLYAEFEILVLESAALIPLLPLGDFCSSDLLCPHLQILAAPYCNKFGLEAQRKNRKTFCCAVDPIYRQIKPRNIWRLSGWPFIFDDKTRGWSEMTGGRDCTGKFRRSVAATLLRRLNYALVPAAASGDFNKSDGILSLNLLNVSLSFPRPNRCPRQRKR